MLAKCIFFYLIYDIVKSEDVVSIDVASELEETRVSPPAGPLVGTLDKSYSGRTYRGFRGIPYAMPPVGERRFERPERLKPWKMERSAKKHGNICVQIDWMTGDGFMGDEDCLFLNIYTPENAQGLDVMFWIHGGDYYMGDGNDLMHGASYYMDYDVVLVTINYRLGHLGFMSTEDAHMPGNQALHDQIMALQWVHDNIAYFGGNPGQVTIFGESSGAACISILRLSPLSAGLFHRVIASSGNSFWVPNSSPTKQHVAMSALLGCPVTSTENMITCLKQINAVELINKTTLMNGMQPTFPTLPRVDREAGDHAVLPDHPSMLLKSGAFQRVPFFTGFMREEGYMFLPYLGSFVDDLDKDFVGTFCLQPFDNWFADCPSVAKKVKEKYFGESKDTAESWVTVMTDSMFSFFALEEARLTAKYSPSFVFRMDFQSEKGSMLDMLFNWGQENYTVTWGKKGTSHGDDLMYHFNYPNTWKVGSAEMKMTTSFIKLFLGFAKNGIPNVADVIVPTFDPSKPSYVLIGGQEDRYIPEINLVSGLATSQETIDFWGKLLHDFGGRQHQTWSPETKKQCHFSG